MADNAGIALITGGAQRIGRAIAEDLAGHGWAVAIHCHRSRKEAGALAAAIATDGGRAMVAAADLADPQAVHGLVDTVVAELGPPSLLVNSAALFERDEIDTLDRDDWDRQLAVNLTAPVFLAKAFAAARDPSAEGNIVNIIDQRVWKPTPLFLSYQIAKSALWTATQTLAQALAPHIRVNAIGPGPALRSQRQSEADFRRQSASVLLEHGPEIGEFGRTVRYFVETPSVTGQMIALDGGQHLAWQTPDITAARE